jgi:hypothetical protein
MCVAHGAAPYPEIDGCVTVPVDFVTAGNP